MKETLNSRERVYKALRHEDGDRFPIDLGMHFSTGISIFAYYNLRKYLGMSTDKVRMADVVWLLARLDDDIIERFHIDTILLNLPYKKTRIWNPRDEYRFLAPEQWNPVIEDGYHVFRHSDGGILRMPLGGFYFDGDTKQVKDHPDEENLKLLCREGERIYKETDKFTCLMGQFSAFFGGMEAACDMITDPDIVKAKNKVLLKNQIDKFFRILEYGGQNIGCIEINGDMGMQSGPFISNACFEEFVFPYFRDFIRVVHDNSDIKVFLHCCGSVKPFIPGFIEAGLDIFNPVQISANNMDPAQLKKEFGSKITFWGGGSNTQTVLGYRDENAVRQDTGELCKIFKPGGGFVFNQVHNIMGDVPPENIVAMLDEAYANSFYNV